MDIQFENLVYITSFKAVYQPHVALADNVIFGFSHSQNGTPSNVLVQNIQQINTCHELNVFKCYYNLYYTHYFYRVKVIYLLLFFMFTFYHLLKKPNCIISHMLFVISIRCNVIDICWRLGLENGENAKKLRPDRYVLTSV